MHNEFEGNDSLFGYAFRATITKAQISRQYGDVDVPSDPVDPELIYVHISNGTTFSVLWPQSATYSEDVVDSYYFTPIQDDNVGDVYDIVWSSKKDYPFEHNVFVHDINKRTNASAQSYGSVTVSPQTNVKEGQIVTCTFTPNNDSSVCSSFRVFDRFGNEITAINPSSNNYTFAMPDGPAHVCFATNENAPCLRADSEILMADYSTKKLRDLKVGDEVVTFDHDNGMLSTKPILWVLPVNKTKGYYHCEFDDGTTLDVVKNHRVYSIDKRSYTRVTNLDEQERVLCFDRVVKLVKIAFIDDYIEFSNALSVYDMNIFANGILTGCGFNNIYEFDDNHKFIKVDRPSRPLSEFKIPKKWYDAMRISEQYASVEDINVYINTWC